MWSPCDKLRDFSNTSRIQHLRCVCPLTSWCTERSGAKSATLVQEIPTKTRLGSSIKKFYAEFYLCFVWCTLVVAGQHGGADDAGRGPSRVRMPRIYTTLLYHAFIPRFYTTPFYHAFIPRVYNQIHIYSTYLYHAFIPRIYTTHLYHAFIPRIYTTHLLHAFIPRIYYTNLYHAFITRIYTTYL